MMVIIIQIKDEKEEALITPLLETNHFKQFGALQKKKTILYLLLCPRSSLLLFLFHSHPGYFPFLLCFTGY